MTRYRLLLTAAATVLASVSAQAQVTVPLPQRPGSTPSAPPGNPAVPDAQRPGQGDGVTVPLPGQGPQVPVPGVPLGPHGRPDINPYDRDIDMTVPLSFQSRSLGDIPLRLTADDRYLVAAEPFVQAMRTVLNEQALGVLATTLQGMDLFAPEALANTGVTLTYDPSALSVVVVEVSAEQRAIENLFAPPRDDLTDVTLAPAGLSAYLNLNLTQTYVWEGNQADPPTINFDGAIRAGRIVFEGDAQFTQRFGGTTDNYEFRRNYARLVYDQAEDYRRWVAGDLDVEIRGLQSYVQMGGVGVVRQQRRFNAFRSAILQSDRQLILQRESTVRFLRNGSLYREIRLNPGRYDFSALPLLSGSNDIQIEVRDNTGAIQNIGFQQYLDPIDLDPGDYEYGAFFGPTSGTFSTAPDYSGPVAFSGFFRKAFFNRPALGVGAQISEDVQNLSAQMQFVLGNGARLLVDGAGSNSGDAGQGIAAGVSLDQNFDRGGLADNFSLRADYVSRNYATLNNLLAINNTSWSLSSQYTRQFSLAFIGTISASYIKGRNNVSDSYRIGATGYYRLNSEWTVRGGVDYVRLPTTFASGNGVSVNIGLVFQPDYRRRAEARYESRDQLAELSYNQSGLNELNSVGFGGVVARQKGSARGQGYAGYAHNRFDVSVSHASFGPNLSAFGQTNATSARIGTTIAFADGVVGLGRRINDSFILLHPHENLGDRQVVAGQSLAQNNYIGRSGALGAAVNNFLSSYTVQSVQYDVQDPPSGYDIGPGVVRVNPPYRSGYSLRIGTDAFVSAMGTLVRAEGLPVSLIGGRVTLLDLVEGETPRPIPFFTNSAGRFAIATLLPGRRYKVETYGPNGTIDESFEFAVPADTDGLVDLGTVRPGSNNQGDR